VEDFDGTLKRVLDHVGLPHDENCARFYESDSRVRTVSYAQVRQPVNARGLGRWKNYRTELMPLIAELEQSGSLAGWNDAPNAPRNDPPPRARSKTISDRLSKILSRPTAKSGKANR
jgi:hypothetical protein